ncbi:MAG TPA: hypothetical protein VKU82_01365, partial [Planctomycetaceae bacterium]|nr:hypothetical protein [Planctomycetaceae bacterium]
IPANVFDNFVTYSEHANLERVHALSYRLHTTEQLGRVSLAVARRINRLEQGLHRLPATIRRLLYRSPGGPSRGPEPVSTPTAPS